MANTKKKRAKRPSPSAASEKLAQDKAEFEASEKESSASKPKKDAKVPAKSQTVVKAQARAKDPKKAAKKPNIFRRFIDYLKQVRLEIKRTTWPTKNEVVNMAIIVLVALLFFGIIIFIIDFVMVFLLDQYANLVPTVDAGSTADAANATAEAASGAADTATDTSVNSGADASADASGGE